MKKILLVLSLVLFVFLYFDKDYFVIPKEAIRFRVISNSNSPEDILMKQKTSMEVMKIFKNYESNDINDTRKEILSNIENINIKVKKLFEENNYDKGITVNYGINEFPEKIYKGIRYNAGNYESLVIKIGEAKGNNYWCVLFPPLCLIDEEIEEVEYKSKIVELFSKYFWCKN